MNSVSQNDIIALALENGGKITPALLSARTPLSIMQANTKLHSLYGIFRTKYDYTDQSQVFILKNKELYNNFNAQSPAYPPPSPVKRLSDAEVIEIALKAKGRISPGLLCVSAKVSIDEAKNKLQELQHKGVFDIEATDSGALVYVLNELDSFSELMDPEID